MKLTEDLKDHGTAWTKEEHKIIKKYWDKDKERCFREINRTRGSIRRRAYLITTRVKSKIKANAKEILKKGLDRNKPKTYAELCEEYNVDQQSLQIFYLQSGIRRKPYGRKYAKNEVIFDSAGYAWVYEPGHPKAKASGRVKRTILVVENQLGRYLGEDEQIHHCNNDFSDDRPENLMVLKNASVHSKIHTFGDPRRCIHCLLLMNPGHHVKSNDCVMRGKDPHKELQELNKKVDEKSTDKLLKAVEEFCQENEDKTSLTELWKVTINLIGRHFKTKVED